MSILWMPVENERSCKSWELAMKAGSVSSHKSGTSQSFKTYGKISKAPEIKKKKY